MCELEVDCCLETGFKRMFTDENGSLIPGWVESGCSWQMFDVQIRRLGRCFCVAG